MRTVLVLTILVISFSCGTNKQITGNIPHYKSFAQYGGDTVKYLDDNFADNKQKYVGKKFKVLMHDLEFPVLSYFSYNEGDMSHSKTMSITFCNNDEKTDRTIDHRKITFIYIYWEDKVPQDDIDKLNNGEPGVWTKKHEKYFGEKFVKDIKVVAFPEGEGTNKGSQSK